MTQLPALTEEQFNAVLQSYRQSVANRFANPYIFSLIGLFYAVRGKLSMFERILLGSAAGATIIMMIRKQKENEPQKIALKLYENYKQGLTASAIN
jgi:hypothetical protein